MRHLLLALAGAAIALATTPATAGPKTYTCTKWHDGVCVSTHRVKGTPPFKMGYVFGPTYTYTTYSSLPPEAVSFYHLDPNNRYVYNDGYIYVVDPVTFAITRVLDTLSR